MSLSSSLDRTTSAYNAYDDNTSAYNEKNPFDNPKRIQPSQLPATSPTKPTATSPKVTNVTKVDSPFLATSLDANFCPSCDKVMAYVLGGSLLAIIVTLLLTNVSSAPTYVYATAGTTTGLSFTYLLYKHCHSHK